MSLYQIISSAHSGNRWLVLIMAIAAVVDFAIGLASKKKFGKLDDVLTLVYTIMIDLQLLLGLILYFFLSPTVHDAISSGLDMSDAQSRFYVVEHPLTMLLAIVFAHVGRATVKRATTDAIKFRRGLIWFTLALVFMLSRMPW